MKMAKASKEDLEAALNIAAALEAVCSARFLTMPYAISDSDDDDDEEFSPDNADQCRRLFEYLRELLDKGSLFRVALGMATVCDPKNKLLDPDDDCLAHHPEIVAALNHQETTNARMTAIFNEWARQYAEDPEAFGAVLAADGRPLPDYGSVCTEEFNRIAAEMDARGALPVPSAGS